MGWPKFCEDIEREQERRGLFDGTLSFGDMMGVVPVGVTAQHRWQSLEVRCPYCTCSFANRADMCRHIKEVHTGSYGVLLLNGELLRGTSTQVDKINSLAFQNYGEKSLRISVCINDETMLVQSSVEKRFGRFEITPVLRRQPVKSVEIHVKDDDLEKTYRIECNLNILELSPHQIVSGYWKSDYFIDNIVEQKYGLPELEKFLQLLAHEQDYDTMEQVMLDLEPRFGELSKDREAGLNFLLYDLLLSGRPENEVAERYLSPSDRDAYALLQDLLAFRIPRENELEQFGERNISQFRTGVLLLHAMLSGNSLNTSFYRTAYHGEGILSVIVRAIEAIQNADLRQLSIVLQQFALSSSLIRPGKFTLTDDIHSVYQTVMFDKELDENTYQRLSHFSPAVCALEIRQTEDHNLQIKRIKSALKRFDTVEWFFNFVQQYLDNDWTASRINMQTPTLYWNYVERENAARELPLSADLLDHAKKANQIQITPLGNAHCVGCSCFVVSVSGYHILLDAGLRPAGNDTVPYPDFEKWEKNIDAIVISHAHIDHAGAVAMAHSMWPDAPVLTTHGTKALLEPFLYDIAFAQGTMDEGDFRFIEKNAACETFQSILACDFHEWIWISPEVGICFHPAGHLLGAAMVELSMHGCHIVYTGDFCLQPQSMAGGAELFDLPQRPDLLICEATNLHSTWEHSLTVQKQHLEQALSDAIHRQKTVLLPSSALGRSQELLYLIQDMKLKNMLPENTPVFVGGFACQTCAAALSAADSSYAQILGECTMLQEDQLPPPGSITIASSGRMHRHSASFQLAEGICSRNRKELHILLSNEQYEVPGAFRNKVRTEACPMRTHADRKDILELIRQLSPYALAMVHWGEPDPEKRRKLTHDIYSQFGGHTLTVTLDQQKATNLWDLKELLNREESLKNG